MRSTFYSILISDKSSSICTIKFITHCHYEIEHADAMTFQDKQTSLTSPRHNQETIKLLEGHFQWHVMRKLFHVCF